MNNWEGHMPLPRVFLINNLESMFKNTELQVVEYQYSTLTGVKVLIDQGIVKPTPTVTE